MPTSARTGPPHGRASADAPDARPETSAGGVVLFAHVPTVAHAALEGAEPPADGVRVAPRDRRWRLARHRAARHEPAARHPLRQAGRGVAAGLALGGGARGLPH